MTVSRGWRTTLATALLVVGLAAGCGGGSGGSKTSGSTPSTTAATVAPGGSSTTARAGGTPGSVDLSSVSSLLSNVDGDISASNGQSEDDPSK